MIRLLYYSIKHILKLLLFCVIFLAILSCRTDHQLKEEDKLFHAGPNMSGFGSTYFGLYKNNIYKFCDGDFIDPGCYTGEYELHGDVLTLKNLKLNDHVKYNRYIVYRYSELDSTYWLNKYPKASTTWKSLKQDDIKSGSEGDIFALDERNNPITEVDYYHVIRYDKLK